jgi:hypothetical protein
MHSLGLERVFIVFAAYFLASSAGISPEESGGRKTEFFSKPIRRLKPIERSAEEAT